uniref:non-specific serine/threonine protein kinase n=1 Tax=Henneguya salminicola TaxID=69463 RepID=A0A6G3MEJ5_HENSL
MLDHQKIHQKFVETTKCNNDKAVRVLLEKQENELDKIHKQRKSVLKKITKSYGVINYEKKNLFHTFRSIQHKARRHAKNLSFLGAGDLKPLYNEPSLLTISSSNDNKNNSLNAIDKVNIKHQTTVTEINTKFINEKYQLLISQCESLGKIELEEVSYLARTEVNKIEQIYRMKKIHLQKLHDLETESQNDYMKRKIHEMEKKHLFDQKNIPKELKLKEMQISKLYKDCIKSIQQHYKALSKMTLEKTPKENHQNVRDKLKEEKMQKIIDIKYNMDQHITSLVNFDQLKLCDIQSNQKFELQQQLNYELKSLKQYQNSQIHQLNIAKGKDLENIAKKYDQITDDSNNKLLSDLSSLHINHSDALSRYSFNNQFTHSLIDTKSTTNSNLNLPFQISSLHITPNLDSQSLSDSIDNKSSSQNSSKM